MRTPNKRALLLNLLLSFVSAFTFLFLLEYGARALGLQTPLYLGPAPNNCLQRSRLLDVEFIPRCRGSTFGTPVVTNAVGLRSPEVRDDGSTRILTIGDSCTFGFKVNEPESYPAQLQNLLDQQVGRRRYQVINAGMPGATTYHGLLYLRERGAALQPSIVIAGYGFNDMTTDGDAEEQLRRTHAALPLVLMDDLMLQRITIYRWLRLKVFFRARRLDQPPRVSPDKYRRNFTEMIELARRQGAQFVLIDLTHGVRERGYPDTLAALSREYSVPLVVYTGPRMDVIHPTAEGYQLLAAQVLAALREAHAVPAAAGG